MKDFTCKQCEKLFKAYDNKGKRQFCSMHCRNEWYRSEEKPLRGWRHSKESKLKMSKNHADVSGEKNPSWKGGIISRHGYLYILRPDHPSADTTGYIAQHRAIIEDRLGRYLGSDEHVHHKDGNKANNEIENLEVLLKSEHHRLHALSYWQKKKELPNG